jgi:hypothetical protein
MEDVLMTSAIAMKDGMANFAIQNCVTHDATIMDSVKMELVFA